MDVLAGVDFGTSNSAVSYINGGSVEMVELEAPDESIPSAMFFKAETNSRLYGNEAISAFLRQDEGRFIRSFKSILGSSLMDSYTRVNKYNIDFRDIIRYFIVHLKSRLDRQAEADGYNVVLGRPVKYNEEDADLDRRAQNMMQEIALAAGFKAVEFQYEPVAAAFMHERDLDEEKLALVIDIGGGTSDFTIIRIGKNLRDKTERGEDILAYTGVKAGGNDFDKNLNYNVFMPLLGRDATITEKKLPMPSHIFHQLSDWSGINFMYEANNMRSIRDICNESNDKEKTRRLLSLVTASRAHELLGIAEEAKIKLTTEDPVSCSLEPVLDQPSALATRRDFDDYSRPVYYKIEKALGECLLQSGAASADIDLVILTGGSTEIIEIKEMTGRLFPGAQISAQNKFTSVCKGLAYDAQRRFL